MGKGTGCCGPSFRPEPGDKNVQVLEGETGKWLPCNVKEVVPTGCCSDKEYVVEYAPSGGAAALSTITVPKAKIREIQAAIRLGEDGLPDLDKGRSCTDCLCIVFFALFVAGWVFISTVAFDKGDPVRLLMPNDFRDEICGEFEPRTNYSEWFVPKPEYKLTYGICVDNCPDPGAIVCNNDWEFQATYEASGLKPWDRQSDWGRNNKAFEFTAEEVYTVNSYFKALGVMPDFGNGTTGTVARVLSMWPNIALEALDPLATVRDCDWRDEHFGPSATVSARLLGQQTAYLGGGTVCTAEERRLLARVVETNPRVKSFNCFSVTYRTEELVHRCVPMIGDREQNESRANQLEGLAEATWAGRYFSDGLGELQACWRVLLISVFTAIIISFIWLALLRLILRPLVYTILLLILAAFIAAGAACHVYADNLEEVTLPGDSSHDEQVQTWRVFSYLFFAASIVYFMVMLWLISRIRIAICVLEEASSALFSAPSVLVIPPLMFLGVCAIFVWFLVIAAYVQTVVDISIADFAIDTSPLNSVDDILSEYLDLSPQSLDLVNNISTNIVDTTNLSDARAGQSSTDEDTIIRYMHAYNFFGFLWCANMLISMAFFVISGVVIMWFWSATTAEILTGEKSKSTVPFAMKNAFYRMLRYHLGTLFFGSLLIAIIQFVRAVLMYVERQLPEELTNSTTFKVIKCLVHCFLAYMERIVKIINCNAYIITGVFGTNFCSSAKRALIFLMANVARAAVLAAMAEIVIFLLKVFICAANVYLAMLMIKEPSLTNDETIESGLFPLFFVLVLSYIIAVIVMNCYDTCISTIFMCSLIDEDRAGDCGDGYVSYVPPKLADLMDNFKAIGELEAEYKAKLRHATAGKSSNPKIRPHPAPAPPASNDVAESKNVPNEGAA